jgi:hypothetical protein
MAVSSINTLSAVEQAVRTASQSTGVDFGFLMRTAKRESGLDANAHAATSSAAGLFQFVEQTWLSTLKLHGAAHGYARYAELIQMGSDGRFHVPSGEEARRAVMDLRLDPHAAATMAGELASDSAAYLRGRVGREPTGGELYAAHFLGPQGSAKLIDAVQTSPNATAASLFHDAAAANHGVFYRDGRALTVSEVYNNLNRTGGGAAAEASPIDADPGQGAFITYASAGRTERLREQAMLVQFIMSDEKDKSPVGSMFSADLLTVLSNARQAQAKGE